MHAYYSRQGRTAYITGLLPFGSLPHDRANSSAKKLRYTSRVFLMTEPNHVNLAHAQTGMATRTAYYWASEASPPSRTNGTIFLYVSFVSPDTVSFLNVSTRFYLGVYAVRNIAILKTVYTLPLAHNAEAFI